MKTDKSYSSVSELLEEVVEEKDLQNEIRKEIQKQTVATALFTMRSNFGVTQLELAKKVGKSQSWVSKLEHSGTDRITVEDLEHYSRALEVNLTIMFQKEMTAAESVKYHFFQIKKHLDGLVELAKDDEDIRKGVNEFYNQWLLNSVQHFLEGKIKLGKSMKRTKPESVKVVGPEDPSEQVDFPRLPKKEDSLV